MSKPEMTRKPSGKATLFVGLGLALLGVVLLFWTQNFLDVLGRWWPSVFAVVGLLSLYHYQAHKARPRFLLLGLLLFLTGTFILLLNTVLAPCANLSQLWPIFMGIVGASIIPYSFRFGRTLRISFIIPSLFLIFFMFALLIFTLQFIKITFTDFVLGWWPLLLVFMGLTLVVAYYLRDQGDDKS
jgi:hypothetical protein